MSETSSKRPIFKIAGIVVAIIGLGFVVFAVISESPEYGFNVPGQPEEFAYVSGENKFQRYGIGGFGVALIYIGFRLVRYIPPSERERDYVSEEDLG
jgi:hypothetical protein|tara:strand:+ start:326 stop:616 length:291 start_codon:yes stop_codon:yes gene_type:complete